MVSKVIGIDPGKNGGIAVLEISGGVIDVVGMPDTPMEILEFISRHREHSICYLEQVGGMPGQGGSAMFTFGRGYGQLEMALLSSGIKTVTVTPQKWQKVYQVGSSSIMKSSAAEKREHKSRLKAKAQQLFPQLGRRVTNLTCDALLIAEYGRMSELNI